jgi:Tfp pilus assembly protein PilN
MRPVRLELDFARSTPRSAAGARGLLALGIVLLGAAGLIVGAALVEQRTLAESLAAMAQRRSAPVAPARVMRPADPQQLARERQLRDLARGLHTPWSDLLAALEAAPSDSVALLSVEPSAARRSVRLSAEARDSQAMLAWLQALQRDPRLAQALLVSHQLQTQAPGTPVRFQVQASWAEGL